MDLNVLNGNLKLSDCKKRKLKKYKAILRKIADKHLSSAKKRLINQRGGFLLPLLSAALPVLADIFFSQHAS